MTRLESPNSDVLLGGSPHAAPEMRPRARAWPRPPRARCGRPLRGALPHPAIASASGSTDADCLPVRPRRAQVLGHEQRESADQRCPSVGVKAPLPPIGDGFLAQRLRLLPRPSRTTARHLNGPERDRIDRSAAASVDAAPDRPSAPRPHSARRATSRIQPVPLLGPYSGSA